MAAGAAVRAHLALGLAAALAAAPAWAQPAADRLACEAAIAAQEGTSRLPNGLLGAIARVESGRWDAQAQRALPWPWAFNTGGTSNLPETRQDALTRVRDLLSAGQSSIDVGCMQINLRHHPAAFGSLEEAFDPQRNVAYAIRLLHQLYARHGDWGAAISRYHSGELERGADYLRRVTLAWTGVATPPPQPMAVPTGGRVAVMISPTTITMQPVRPAPATPATRPVATPIPRGG